MSVLIFCVGITLYAEIRTHGYWAYYNKTPPLQTLNSENPNPQYGAGGIENEKSKELEYVKTCQAIIEHMANRSAGKNQISYTIGT